jgi:hypothetical protein
MSEAPESYDGLIEREWRNARDQVSSLHSRVCQLEATIRTHRLMRDGIPIDAVDEYLWETVDGQVEDDR